ncbi:MAG: hypothetical protein AB1758_05385, partial [Candidatus Eremiobacterota bacterium]
MNVTATPPELRTYGIFTEARDIDPDGHLHICVGIDVNGDQLFDPHDVVLATRNPDSGAYERVTKDSILAFDRNGDKVLDPAEFQSADFRVVRGGYVSGSANEWAARHGIEYTVDLNTSQCRVSVEVPPPLPSRTELLRRRGLALGVGGGLVGGMGAAMLGA